MNQKIMRLELIKNKRSGDMIYLLDQENVYRIINNINKTIYIW